MADYNNLLLNNKLFLSKDDHCLQLNSMQQILIFFIFACFRLDGLVWSPRLWTKYVWTRDQFRIGPLTDYPHVHGPWSSIAIIKFIGLLQKRFNTTESRNSNSENLAWRLRLFSCWIAQMPEIIRIQTVKIIRNKLISEK